MVVSGQRNFDYIYNERTWQRRLILFDIVDEIINLTWNTWILFHVIFFF